MLGDGFLRACSSALSHSIDAGIGVEDGGEEPDELDEEDVIDRPWDHDRNEVLRIALYSNPVTNEMWFLTVDPLVRVSAFIAKLSKRQHCWRILEDFHSQEYILFFEVNCGIFMRLHLLHWLS